MLDIRKRKFKVHSLTGRITRKVMDKSFKAVKRNRGAAGIDKVSIEMFEANIDQNLDALMRDMKSGTYRPRLLRRVYIPKADGRKRPLGIPVVRDRVAQEVVRRLIDPTFEALFHPDSFGFRRHRNAHQAIERVLRYVAEGYDWVVDADIKGFFDNIGHKLIMRLVAAEIADGKVLGHIERFLKSGVMEDGVPRPTVKGTPQGGVISPLLANIVLNYLDWKFHAEGYKFVRYADDFVVLSRTRAEAEKALAFARCILEDLGLQLHPEKTCVVRFSQGIDFLGFTLSNQTRRMRHKAVERYKMKIRDLTVRSHNLDAQVIVKLNRVIRGTLNYFGASFATGAYLFRQLDKWTRKRIRCMKYKRISRRDNYRLRKKHIARMRLLSACELFHAARGPTTRSP